MYLPAGKWAVRLKRLGTAGETAVDVLYLVGVSVTGVSEKSTWGSVKAKYATPGNVTR
jgi:hypothetical protein